MLRVSDGVADCIRLAIPQPTEWRRIGDEIKAAFIFARADFVKMTTTLRLHQAATCGTQSLRKTDSGAVLGAGKEQFCVLPLSLPASAFLQQFYL